MRRRFFVERFRAESATLQGDAAEHLGRVLRAQLGQLYELSDGNRVWLSRVERVALSKRGSIIDFSLIEPIPARESGFPICLLISIVKFDRFEWCLEKAAELGATEIIPLAAARTDKPIWPRRGSGARAGIGFSSNPRSRPGFSGRLRWAMRSLPRRLLLARSPLAGFCSPSAPKPRLCATF